MIPEKKKKILIRIGSLRHGGAEKVLATFLKNLPEDKFEIDLLLNLYSGKYLADIPSWINVCYLNKGEMITTNRPQDLPRKAFRVLYQGLLKKFPKLLYQFVLKNKVYDIEFAAIHGFRDEILNSPLKSSKKIVWIHNDLRKTEFHNYTDAEIRKFFGFDAILVISDHILQDFTALAKTEEEKQKLIRIYNPLDTADILRKSVETENIISKPANKSTVNKHQPQTEILPPSTHDHPTFISVGTVFPQKGFDRLLHVHKRLLDEGWPHRIKIVGNGYDWDNIQRLINTLHVNDSVEMTGFCANPYPHMAAADFYILSSRYEGFPTVLFEAITLKKRIIATDVSGVREMLLDGHLGEIVDNSEDGIYQGMKLALRNPAHFDPYLQRLANYQMPFSLEKSVNHLVHILEKL